MPNTSAILGWPSSTEDFTLGGGNWQTAYPRDNLTRMPLSKVARTISLAAIDTAIAATSTNTRRVGLIALARHNFSLLATIRIRLYLEAAMTTLLYDSGVEEVWPEVYPYDTLEWEDDNYWTGKYTDAELAGTTWLWLWWVGYDYNAAGIRIDISDPTNPAGYVQAGYLEIAAQYQVAYNFSYGAQYGFRYRTVTTEALGGAKYFDDRAKPRVFKGSFRSPHDEALAKQFEMRRQRDICDPVIWVPNPDERVHWVRTAMLAQFQDPGMFSYYAVDIDEVPIQLEEIIG
jgi:hypothetical protein